MAIVPLGCFCQPRNKSVCAIGLGAANEWRAATTHYAPAAAGEAGRDRLGRCRRFSSVSVAHGLVHALLTRGELFISWVRYLWRGPALAARATSPPRRGRAAWVALRRQSIAARRPRQPEDRHVD